MKCRRRHYSKKKIVCIVFSTFMVYSVLSVYTSWRNAMCSDRGAQQLINDVCALYEDRKLAGNLCVPLCEDSLIRYNTCLNYNGGKVVILADFRDRELVLKSKFVNLSAYGNIAETMGSLTYPVYPSHEQFHDMVVNSVTFSIGLSLVGKQADGIIDRLWNRADIYNLMQESTRENIEDINEDLLDINKDKHSVNSLRFRKVFGQHTLERLPHWQKRIPQSHRAIMQSMWMLLEQEEYVFMKMYQHNAHIPQIYGTCGPIYAMEYAPPGDVLNPQIKFDLTSWEERARVGLALLDLIESMDKDFQQPMHMCDMKGENFGVGKDGKIKLIDTDMIFHDNKMLELFDGNCTVDKDCDFFDCFGYCDPLTLECMPVGTNNNLQSMCNDVLKGKWETLFKGVLRSPPNNVKHELRDLLEECTKPPSDLSTKVTSRKASKEVLEKLRLLLELSVSIGRK